MIKCTLVLAGTYPICGSKTYIVDCPIHCVSKSVTQSPSWGVCKDRLPDTIFATLVGVKPTASPMIRARAKTMAIITAVTIPQMIHFNCKERGGGRDRHTQGQRKDKLRKRKRKELVIDCSTTEQYADHLILTTTQSPVLLGGYKWYIQVYIVRSRWEYPKKILNNFAILHPILMQLAPIGLPWKCTYYTKNLSIAKGIGPLSCTHRCFNGIVLIVEITNQVIQNYIKGMRRFDL